jgi:hypothetical protein
MEQSLLDDAPGEERGLAAVHVGGKRATVPSASGAGPVILNPWIGDYSDLKPLAFYCDSPPYTSEL